VKAALAALAALTVAPSAFAPVSADAALDPIDSLDALRRHVERWSEVALSDRGPQEIADVVGWLDRSFYRFRD
jgi:hypothetical protein